MSALFFFEHELHELNELTRIMENVNIDPISAVSELEKDIMEVCEKHGFHYVGHSEIRIDKRYNCMRDYGMSVGFKVVKML